MSAWKRLAAAAKDAVAETAGSVSESVAGVTSKVTAAAGDVYEGAAERIDGARLGTSEKAVLEAAVVYVSGGQTSEDFAKLEVAVKELVAE